MNLLKTKPNFKTTQKILFQTLNSCLFSLIAVFSIGMLNLSSPKTQLPTYVQYLQHNWGWNQKIKTSSTTDYTVKINRPDPFCPYQTPSLTEDLTIWNSGSKVKDNNKTSYSNVFYTFLQNYGIDFGFSVGKYAEKNAQDSSEVFYFYFPLLKIHQNNLTDDNLSWHFVHQNKVLRLITLSIKDPAKHFHADLKFYPLHGRWPSPADLSKIVIIDYHGDPSLKNYTSATITYNPVWSNSQPTKYYITTKHIPPTGLVSPMLMLGAYFNVQINSEHDKTRQLNQPFRENNICQTIGYFDHNLFSFLTTTYFQSSNQNLFGSVVNKKETLLAIDSSTLLAPTNNPENPTQLNTDTIAYVDNFIEPATGLSPMVIVGIVIGSVGVIVLITCFSVWGYRHFKSQLQKPNTKH